MRLGLLTAPFADTPLDDVADWTAANGFESIEIACWPRSSGDTRRYAGTSHIDVANLTKDGADEIVGRMNERGLVISGLGYYPNPLHPDPAHREMVIGHLRHVITAAELMNVGLVNTFMGADAAKNQDQNWEDAMFTPDRSAIVAVYTDGEAYEWPVSLRSWQDQACSVARRNLTAAEWKQFVGFGSPRGKPCG